MTGPYEINDDSVTARLSVEVPDDSIQNLQQLTRGFQLLRVELEAATRMQGNYSDYITNMPEILERATQAQRSYLSELERSSLIQAEIGRGAGAASAIPGGANTGYVDPFAGMTEGLGEGTRGFNASSEEIRETLQQVDPRQVANMQAQNGRPPSLDELQERFRGTTGEEEEKRQTRRQRANEDQQGQTDPNNPDSPPGRQEQLRQLGTDVFNQTRGGNLGQAFRTAATGIGGMMGGGVGTAVKAAGIGAGVIGAGLAVNRGIQNLGETYQDYKNYGSIQGGGFGEGVAQEFQAYTMAISPFITTDQSRRIVQQGLTEGYHGKTFDTITELVAFNTKEMAMDIGMSFATIRKQMIEGGQTSEGYRAQQEMTRQLAQNSEIKSLPQLQQEIASTQGAYIDLGVPAGDAGQIAASIASAFPDDPLLAGVATKIGNSAASGDSQLLMQVMMYARQQGETFPPRTMPESVPMILGPAKFQKYLWGYLKTIAQRYRGAPDIFTRFVTGLGVPLTPNEGRKLQAALLGGADPATEGQQEVSQASGNVVDRGGSRGSPVNGADLYGVLGKDQSLNERIDNSLGGRLVRGIGELFSGNFSEAGSIFSGNNGSRERYSLPVMEGLVKEFGGRDKIEIVDPEGNVHGYNPDDQAQREGLSNNQWKWRKKGSDQSYTLDQSMGVTAESYGKQEVSVGGSVQLELSPDARRLLQQPNQIQLTPNQARANEGYGDSTPNNPPPGDFPFGIGGGGYGR